MSYIFLHSSELASFNSKTEHKVLFFLLQYPSDPSHCSIGYHPGDNLTFLGCYHTDTVLRGNVLYIDMLR